jgi:hypothetical protein
MLSRRGRSSSTSAVVEPGPAPGWRAGMLDRLELGRGFRLAAAPSSACPARDQRASAATRPSFSRVFGGVAVGERPCPGSAPSRSVGPRPPGGGAAFEERLQVGDPDQLHRLDGQIAAAEGQRAVIQLGAGGPVAALGQPLGADRAAVHRDGHPRPGEVGPAARRPLSGSPSPPAGCPRGRSTPPEPSPARAWPWRWRRASRWS